MAPTATTLAAETESNASVAALGMTVSGKKLKIRAYPTFDNLEDERLYRKQHLAAAFRVYGKTLSLLFSWSPYPYLFVFDYFP